MQGAIPFLSRNDVLSVRLSHISTELLGSFMEQFLIKGCNINVVDLHLKHVL